MDELSSSNYVVIDDFIQNELYLKLRSYFHEKQNNFTMAGIGALEENTIDRRIRGDLTYWLDRTRDEELVHFWELVDQMLHIFNRYCFLSLSGYEFHLAHYPPGGHYDKHLDQFESRNNRMISVVIYLNESWQRGDGGELELFNENGSTKIVEPIAGRCVLFKSAVVPHAVLQAHKSRYSLTGWLLYQPSKMGQFFG